MQLLLQIIDYVPSCNFKRGKNTILEMLRKNLLKFYPIDKHMYFF